MTGSEEPGTSRYDGHGLCYLEFGSGNVGAVDVTFTPGSPPVGHLLGPDVSYVADKIEFGNISRAPLVRPRVGPLTSHVSSSAHVSSSTVTGPSFSSATFMCAPNEPVATVAPKLAQGGHEFVDQRLGDRTRRGRRP